MKYLGVCARCKRMAALEADGICTDCRAEMSGGRQVGAGTELALFLVLLVLWFVVLVSL